jgi:hypothetical protein
LVSASGWRAAETTATTATGQRRTVAAIEHHRAALFRRWCCATSTWLLQPVRHDVDRALVDEPDHERAALDHVAVADRLFLHARVVEVRAVRAAEILDDKSSVFIPELRVATRHHAVVGTNCALQPATDVDRVGG